MTQFQPTLPAEVPFTDAELAFLDESPPGLFPENQNSNLGLLRKIFSDLVQELINQQNTIYNEHFVDTALQFLDEWELQVGLPSNPTGLTTQQRRNLVTNKLRVGPFTRTRRDAIVKSFVSATLGDAVQLTPAGVALTGSGVPLYSGLTSLVGAYTITENISGFSFTITVAQGVTLDTVALTRELNRVVPAGISFSVVTANQVFKSSSDSGTATQSQSVTTQTTPTSSDSGTGSDFGIRAPGTVVGTESGVGSDSALVGFGSGSFGGGPFGGYARVTGTARITLSAISTPSTLEQVILRVRAKKHNVADAGTLLVSLYQGSTLIEAFPIVLTDNFVTTAKVLRNAGSITNWGALEVRLQGQASNINGTLTADVSFIELQTAP